MTYGKRISRIRAEEKQYHDSLYRQNKVFEPGTWLAKPAKIVLDVLNHVPVRDRMCVLDLGCGVGRNGIPVARKIAPLNGKVFSVDLLATAIKNLQCYAAEHQLANLIAIQDNISRYQIAPDTFDYIFAVSSLEHVDSFQTLENVLRAIQKGTRPRGINLFVINTEVEEFDAATGKKQETFLEVNLPVIQMHQLLQHIYQNWNVFIVLEKRLGYTIQRSGHPVIMKTHVLTFAAEKKRS